MTPPHVTGLTPRRSEWSMAGVEHVLIVGASRGLGLELTRVALGAATRVTAIARRATPAPDALRAQPSGLQSGLADVRSHAGRRAVARGLGAQRVAGRG